MADNKSDPGSHKGNQTTATEDSSDQTEHLVSAKEMAAHYGVSSSTFLLWFHSRIVPGVQIAKRRHRFDPDQVEMALKKHARGLADNAAGKFPRFT